ncbi:MAG: fahA [Polaromonas sp.]|nr:fahA [Polaromonas sp.]
MSDDITQDGDALNPTHHPEARSWVASANAEGCDFPIQNLPFAVFRRAGSSEAFRGGVAIGDQVIDMAQVATAGCLEGLAQTAAEQCAKPVLNDFLAMGPAAWKALRHSLFELLEKAFYGPKVDALRTCLIAQADIEFTVPTAIGDYTDFYTSLDHAMNIGKMMRPDDPITSNFKWMPIAYHGRVSTIGVSGQTYRRPMGQAMPPGASAPVYGPCARLDYELELGIYIGQGNAPGEPVALAAAEPHIFGICLLNDWSARDIQFWEMAPLGPFLGKNFCTTISPWIVTMEALAPYRQAWTRPAGDPQPLAYLESQGNRDRGALDISLEVWLDTDKLRAAGQGPSRLSRTSFKHQYWTIAQMVTHHTMGGCKLQSGDLLGSGTISGPGPGEAGAMIELTYGGSKPVTLSNGEQRGFLHDGDAVMLRGWCEKPGHARIGFGESRGQVLPALEG